MHTYIRSHKAQCRFFFQKQPRITGPICGKNPKKILKNTYIFSQCELRRGGTGPMSSEFSKRTHSFTRARTHSCTYAHTQTHTHTHTYTRAYTQKQTQSHNTPTLTYIYVHKFIHIYKCICYGVATISRLLKIVGLFCRISSL